MLILGCEVVCRNIHLSWFYHDHFNFGFHVAAVGELSASNRLRKKLKSMSFRSVFERGEESAFSLVSL
jgi:hypothetical protein